MKRTRLILMAALMGFALAGCDNTPQNMTEEYILPQKLKEMGCEIFKVKGSGVSNLKVVYCPNAQVTTEYPHGKHRDTVTTIDESKDYGY